MWQILSFSVISTIASLSLTTSAYYIDGSCSADARSTIEQSMADIKDVIIPDTSNLLRSVTSDEEKHDFVSWLFGNGDFENAVWVATDVFKKLGEIDYNLQTYMGLNQLQIFCDEGRFVKNTESDKRLRDKTNGLVFQFTQTECQKNGIFDAIFGSGTQAWTVKLNGKRDQDGIRVSDTRVELQICPDYLKKALSRKKTLTARIKELMKRIRSGFSNKQNMNIATVYGRQHMDVLCGFTCTLLHELTHSLTPATIHAGDSRQGGENTGWVAVRKLADGSNYKAAQNNADTMAYLGIGSTLLKEYTIDQNGNVRPRPNARRWLRW
ncbi:hypothetical protein F5B20DRAFT_518140 [Whalleya microplaca]|nr:hypothetical protein F5B20DRAFT_518140 [Whalleya microplaca]